MFAGPLDRRLTWQAATPSTDDFGGTVNAWIDSFETWCCKLQQRGLENVQAGESVDAEVAVLQFRWRPNLKTTDRVVFEGRTWRIQGLSEIGRRDGWQVTLRTRTDSDQVEGG